MKKTARKAVTFSKPVQHRLNMYALAAGAAGMSVLGSSPTEAKIIYTPANVQISGKPFPIDFNNDGINDFWLFHYGFHTTTGGNALLACIAPFFNGTRTVCVSSSLATNAKNAFRVVESMQGEWGAAVQPGAKIVGGDNFRSEQPATLGNVFFTGTSQNRHPHWGGPWVDGGKGVKNRYVGVKFQIQGLFHYGWARITVTTTSDSFTATLTGYAYETIPGKGIIAGKTTGPDVVVEPATLGHLAQGAQAVRRWRTAGTDAQTDH